MAITQVKIRAKITIGGFTAVTPAPGYSNFIQSFTVRKQRGQVGSFDASLKVSHEQVTGSITGDSVKIYAGEGVANSQIFTGSVKAAKISPCFDDPDYVILSVSGVDSMSLLQGKKYTRRCRATKAAWCAITGVVRRGLKSGKFTYNTEPVIYKEAGLDKKSANGTATAPVGPRAGANTPNMKKPETTGLNIITWIKKVIS